MFGKLYFERVFSKADPYGYRTCQYELVKYQRQTEIIRQFAGSPKSILEIGCAEGAHTLMLADAFPEALILAVDISSRALERARCTCGSRQKITFLEADVTRPFCETGLAGRRFDVVIQSESLYYVLISLFFRGRLFRYLDDLLGTMEQGSLFVTSNGLSIFSRMVLGIFYQMMKRRADLVYDSVYREWNEVRKKYMTYDVKVFRLRG